MQDRWKLALIGIAAAVILTLVGAIAKKTSVETELAERTTNALANDALPWARLDFDGRDAILSGTAPTEEAKKLAVKSVGRVWGVRAVEDRIDLMPKQAPYKVVVSRDGNMIELSGFVPKSSARDLMLTSVKKLFPDGGLIYDLPLARGAPPKLNRAVDFSLTQLKDMTAGKITIADKVIDFAGTAVDQDAYRRITKSVDNSLPTGFILGQNNIQPAVVKPYSWAASLSDGSIVLDGYVSSEAERSALIKKVKSAFPSAVVDDRMVPGSGAPEGISAAMAFSIAQLSGLVSGKVSLQDLKLSISGNTDDLTIFQAVTAALDNALPAGVTLVARNVEKPAPNLSPASADESQPGTTKQFQPAVTPEPIGEQTWRIIRTSDRVTLVGAVPDEEALSELLALASTKFGAMPIDDQQSVVEGLPDGFFGAVRLALQAVSRLGEGQADVRPGSVKISGSTYNLAAAENVRDGLLEGLPAGFNADLAALSVQKPGQAVSAEECQKLFISVLQSNKIRFEAAKAVIQRDSFGLLDRLAYISQRCLQSRVEVQGHTDSDGSGVANQALSEKRASSVVTYLIVAGVDADRLSPVGYGETRPIAPNGTDQGKTLNRRIEFRIVQK